MSLMIVKVSSTAAFYQNQTEALRTRNLQGYNPATNVTDTTIAPIALVENDYQQQRQQQQQLQEEEEAEEEVLATNFTQPKTQPLKPPKYRKFENITEEMRAKIVEQQQHQQQQQPQQLHAITDETAYLLERIDEQRRPNAHEQPIYGTWRTKARRPQPSTPLLNAAAAPSAAGGIAASAALNVGDERHDSAYQQQHQHQPQQKHHHHHHLYEQLPKRSSTMTPLKSELHDQIPRPPRLTSRRPSILVRREYLETPINASLYRDELRPKPFQFPHDGPMPQEFKKTEAERGAEVHNIQDILQQMHLGGGGGGPSKNMPQLVMMPTGLHIAGSFKNLKSSGISNFFRNKRNKKQMQLTFPVSMPMQLLSNYQGQPLFNAQQPFQQRLAIDQFYPFKPRSPNDINLLAMHQQLKANRSKKKEKNKQKKAAQIANSNLMLQHTNQRPFAAVADPYLQNYAQLFDLNATQKPKLKRVPFKVNLDIFPVMPATRDYKAASSFTLDEAKLPVSSSSLRPPTVLRNPFMEYYPVALLPSAAAFTYASHQYEQPIYTPFKFPSQTGQSSASLHLPQSSNMKITFPDQQMQKYAAQQYPMPKPHFLRGSSPNHQTSFLPAEVVGGHQQQQSSTANSLPHNNNNNKSNQIMVHLNVFPKQKPIVTPSLPSTNPFYSNALNINRNVIPEQQQQQSEQQQPQRLGPLGPIEPRNLSKFLNVTNAPLPQPVSRSDTVDLQPLVDFEHPIVAADIPEHPHAAALVSNKLDAPELPLHYDSVEGRNNNYYTHNNSNFNFNPNANVEQMASEAKTASLFRFPVEDLIQFQVDDAL